MTQPGQEPPTIPTIGEISPMSGPETAATAEGDENIDSDIKDVQVRGPAPYAGATLHGSGATGASRSLTYTTYCFMA